MRDGFEAHVFARCFRFGKTLHRDLNIDLGQKCGDSSPIVSRRRRLKKRKVRKTSPKVLKITKPSFFYNDFYNNFNYGRNVQEKCLVALLGYCLFVFFPFS